MSVMAFNNWDVDSVKVTDKGLQKYITLTPRLVPKTGARYAGNRFHKSKVFILERLINKLSVSGHKGKKHHKSSGHMTGKVMNSYKIVEEALKLIETRTKKNPILVFVSALENAAPREEIITIEYGGARYPKAVECAPQRRVDIALRNMVQASYAKSFNGKRKIIQALADEIQNAYELSPNSQAVSKKRDLERQADASR
ncbi:MAG: 30S ribosomal protein S7 [archaeon]